MHFILKLQKSLYPALKPRNGPYLRYFTEFGSFRGALGITVVDKAMTMDNL